MKNLAKICTHCFCLHYIGQKLVIQPCRTVFYSFFPLPFVVLNKHFIGFYFLSLLSILIIFLFLKFFFSGCPKVCNIRLQLTPIHFQIAPYHFTGSVNTYKYRIKLIPLTCSLYIAIIHFTYTGMHNHIHAYVHTHTQDIYVSIHNRIHCIIILNELLYVRSIKNKKNESFNFPFVYSCFNALPYFMWI